MTKYFAPGKHIGGGNPPSNRVPNTPANGNSAGVQPKGQFGKPSGKTVASPLSRLNGVLKGAGKGKPSTTVPGGSRGAYGKVRVR